MCFVYVFFLSQHALFSMVHPQQHSPGCCRYYFCIQHTICPSVPHTELFTVPMDAQLACSAFIALTFQRQGRPQANCNIEFICPALKSVNTLSSCSSNLLLLVAWITQVWCVEFIPKMGIIFLFEFGMFAPIWSHMHEQSCICMNASEWTWNSFSFSSLRIKYTTLILPIEGLNDWLRDHYVMYRSENERWESGLERSIKE